MAVYVVYICDEMTQNLSTQSDLLRLIECLPVATVYNLQITLNRSLTLYTWIFNSLEMDQPINVPECASTNPVQLILVKLYAFCAHGCWHKSAPHNMCTLIRMGDCSATLWYCKGLKHNTALETSFPLASYTLYFHADGSFVCS